MIGGVEMDHSFDSDFVIRRDDWNAAFDLSPSSAEVAITATIED